MAIFAMFKDFYQNRHESTFNWDQDQGTVITFIPDNFTKLSWFEKIDWGTRYQILKNTFSLASDIHHHTVIHIDLKGMNFLVENSC
jgi:tRNA A-37 threonylcarbamoyl transferase component Bud32